MSSFRVDTSRISLVPVGSHGNSTSLSLDVREREYPTLPQLPRLRFVDAWRTWDLQGGKSPLRRRDLPSGWLRSHQRNSLWSGSRCRDSRLRRGLSPSKGRSPMLPDSPSKRGPVLLFPPIRSTNPPTRGFIFPGAKRFNSRNPALRDRVSLSGFLSNRTRPRCSRPRSGNRRRGTRLPPLPRQPS